MRTDRHDLRALLRDIDADPDVTMPGKRILSTGDIQTLLLRKRGTGRRTRSDPRPPSGTNHGGGDETP